MDDCECESVTRLPGWVPVRLHRGSERTLSPSSFPSSSLSWTKSSWSSGSLHPSPSLGHYSDSSGKEGKKSQRGTLRDYKEKLATVCHHIRISEWRNKLTKWRRFVPDHLFLIQSSSEWSANNLNKQNNKTVRLITHLCSTDDSKQHHT